MIPQFLFSIIAVLALIFAPLEALFSLGTSESSSANTYTGSSAIDKGVPAMVTVPPFTGNPRDFADFKAAEGSWVSQDWDTDVALTFVPNDEEDPNIEHHDPQLIADIGCTRLEATVMYKDQRLQQLSDTTETTQGECSGGGAERAKFKLLLASNPRVFVKDDTMWLASRTQVLTFHRTLDY